MEKKSSVNIEYKDQEITAEPRKEMRDLWGTYKTVTKFPTSVWATYVASPTTYFFSQPVKGSEQIIIYKNGATKRLYWYDPTNDIWSYVTATA
jgi:hypothetical protein